MKPAETYLANKLCIHGHIETIDDIRVTRRYARNHNCVVCTAGWNLKFSLKPENRHYGAIAQQKRRDRDPESTSQYQSEYHKNRRKEHPEIYEQYRLNRSLPPEQRKRYERVDVMVRDIAPDPISTCVARDVEIIDLRRHKPD